MRAHVGRGNEQRILQKLVDSPKSEFAVVYGRRRVGKTFLIRHFFENTFDFQITGIANVGLQQQLANFRVQYQKYTGIENTESISNWLQAFSLLIKHLENSKSKRKVVFIDELPWFDTAKSGFIQALEHFWNSWASARNDILLITCGSSASWMINKLINNKGGLHNRVTQRIKLNPFTLAECQEYLNLKHSKLDQYQIIQLYMAIGGIPFYWDEVDPSLSAIQNIDKICFSENALLQNEFYNLFPSLFKSSEKHTQVVIALSSKSKGLTREEIINKTDLTNAGSTTRILNELEESGFIQKYTPIGKKRRNSYYRISDFYTNFFFKFIESKKPFQANYWQHMIDNPAYRAWSGYAFEQICYYHSGQITKALDISGMQTTISSWKSEVVEKGAQIDLVIDRRDQVINLFEMKFSTTPFLINKAYSKELENKLIAFKEETKTRKSVFLSFVTTFGLKENEYSNRLVQNRLTMSSLFIDI